MMNQATIMSNIIARQKSDRDGLYGRSMRLVHWLTGKFGDVIVNIASIHKTDDSRPFINLLFTRLWYGITYVNR